MTDAADTFVLPTGTVTFMLTDVVGSSRSWETAPDAMSVAIRRHYLLLDESIGAHGGVRPVEQGEGDSTVSAFSRASDALAAARDAQLALAAEPWPDDAPIRIRMALHTGEAQLRDDGNYFGPSIIRCARIRDTGHGGQVLVSDATAALACDRLPDGCRLADLGPHRLRDLGRPERLWQLTHPYLEEEFPPLRSVEAFRQNLPTSLTPLIGRRRAIREVAELVGAERLVTLTGSGGVGKTRLALAVAGEMLEQYPGGVWWVDLAPVSDDAAVPRAALAAVGAAEAGSSVSLAHQLAAELGPQRSLLVLDNCEHLVGACADFAAELLTANPGVTLLGTSREPLGVPGEVTWRVPSLGVPSLERATAVEALAQFDAVRLFIDRARRARPSFSVDEQNAPAIAQICYRLDGIPLAIELAAARCRQMSADRVATDLDDRFRLLTGGARTVMPRQQTLAASVSWSHDLLDDDERVVFRRLGVFAGTFSLEAAESVVAGPAGVRPEEVFDVVSRLVDKNLVVADDAGPAIRYRLLETLRAFALEEAKAAGELDGLRRAHAEWWATWLEQIHAAEPSEAVADEIELYHDNLVAAVRWGQDHPGLGLRLLAQLGRPWQVLGRYGAALELADGLLFSAANAEAHGEHWRAAARGLAVLYVQSGRFEDYSTLLDLLEENAERHGAEYDAVTARWLRSGLDLPHSLELQRVARRDRQRWGESLATVTIAEAALESDPASAGPLVEEARDLAEQTGSSYQREAVMLLTAKAAVYGGDLASALDCGHRLIDGRAAVHQGAGVAVLALVGLLSEDPDAVAAAVRAGDRVRAKQLAVPVATFADGVRDLLAGRSTRFAALMASVRESRMGLQFRGYGNGVISVLARANIDAGGGDGIREWADTLTSVLAGSDKERGPLPRAVQAAVDGAATSDPYHWHEALRLAADHRLPVIAVDALEGLAVAAGEDEDWADSLRILAAAERLRRETGYRWRFSFERQRVEAVRARARDELGEGADAAISEGAALDWQEAARYVQRSRGGRQRPRHGWDSLTPTEHEVVALVSEGLTNPQVAERLLISRSTVKTHLEHIYAKLGVHGRAQLAAEAARRNQES